jgi:broad specificity phosphatase PhoE
MSTQIILFRHGLRFTDTRLADGPLTADGINTVTLNARKLANEIEFMGTLDVALVSSSIRCTQTFIIIWTAIHEQMKFIREIDVSRNYYCTHDEEARWLKLYAKSAAKIRDDERVLGEKKAIMKHAGNLVGSSALRIIGGISRAMAKDAKSILVVTHSPHDTFIEEAFTGNPQPDCLKLGEYRTITPTQEPSIMELTEKWREWR